MEERLAAIEAKLAAIEAKLDALYKAIEESEVETDREDFESKWGPAISEISDKQKKLYGDDWNEMDGLFDHHRKHMYDEGYNEEETINSYIEGVKAKFAKLTEEAATPEAKEEVKALESAALDSADSGDKEGVKEIVEKAEEVVEADPSEDEIKGWLAEGDFSEIM